MTCKPRNRGAFLLPKTLKATPAPHCSLLGIAQKTHLLAERTAQTNPGRKEQVMADEKEELEPKDGEGTEGEGFWSSGILTGSQTIT